MSLKSTVILAALAAVVAQPCLADEQKVKTYERKVTDNWTVYGIAYPKQDRNDVCVAYKEWKDGSKIELIKDLKSGELRIWHQTMGWNRINDAKEKTYTLRMNFYDQQGGVVDGGDIGYTLINKNTILIPQIDEKRFLKAFVNSNRLNMIPEGNVSNTQAYFDGKANEIAVVWADCIQMSRKASPSAAVGGKEAIEPPSFDLPARTAARYPL